LFGLYLLAANSKERASYWYYRGKAWDCFPTFQKEAERALSKAVKLNPKHSRAWNALSSTFWKKGNLTAARSCLDTSLSVERNAEGLRMLSMLLRHSFKSEEERMANAYLSVKAAREAVGLQVESGESWYVLGNAYLHLFFVASSDESDLNRALQGYRQAEGCCQSPIAPTTFSAADLYYNRAQVYRFASSFQHAVDGFLQAEALDSTLGAGELASNLAMLVMKAAVLVQKMQTHPPANKHGSPVVLSSSPSTTTTTSMSSSSSVAGGAELPKSLHGLPVVPLESLLSVMASPGSAPPSPTATSPAPLACAIVARVELHLTQHDASALPQIYLVREEGSTSDGSGAMEGRAFALHLFGSRGGKAGDWVGITHPVVKSIRLVWEEKTYTYPSIAVYNAADVWWNGKASDVGSFVPAAYGIRAK
jgi:tetratricopeptide (TPR) repeat protein